MRFSFLVITVAAILVTANIIIVTTIEIKFLERSSIVWNSNQKSITESEGENPVIVWLQSYPNSGTSYTMELVQNSTQTTVATNYGKEPSTHGFQVKPLYRYSPSGPYIVNPKMELPKNFILTKTHCSGYCDNCKLGKYITSYDQFVTSCSQCRNGTRLKTFYHQNVTATKIVRLIRNPFDNVVSNYHHFRKKEIRKGRLNFNFTNDVVGFKDYCKYQHELFHQEEAGARLSLLLKNKHFDDKVPCHQGFFRYIQWHKHARKMSKTVPTLEIHYEDYEEDFTETVKRLFEFLELGISASIPKFIPGKTYHEYYTPIEKAYTWKLLEELTNPPLFNFLRSRYKAGSLYG